MAEKRLSDMATKAYVGDNSYVRDNAIRLENLKKETRVPVYGNPLYKTFMGNVYSFDFQDFPVTIKFDGTMQYYPETIAKLIMKKLDGAAMSNVPKEVGDGDKL